MESWMKHACLYDEEGSEQEKLKIKSVEFIICEDQGGSRLKT